ncbi:hypothetical protein [Moraxella lacunata]|uniref:hypothetical protein n=1 Tax=Moraxella lacunata TaxID=477 RepID=UPI003EE135F1
MVKYTLIFLWKNCHDNTPHTFCQILIYHDDFGQFILCQHHATPRQNPKPNRSPTPR